jgi:hypothetical protein
VPLDQTDAGVSEVEEQAVPGEMIDPTAAAETAEEPAAPPAT